MPMNRREFLQDSATALAFSALTPGLALDVPASSVRRKVIYDQDNSGPLGTDIQAMLMLLQADNVDLLGITLVTGDDWLKQEMAYTLRLLEMMGRTKVPVFAGAELPMINRKEEALLRYQLYGGHRLDPWLGAFNRSSRGPGDVRPLPPPYNRFAELTQQQEHAARFIIRTVRENPGQVTLYAGGPLTNVALAILLDPGIVPLVPEIIFMGAGINLFTNAFNVFFDPEASRIVLRAPWPKVTIVTVDLGEQVHIGDELHPGRRMVEEISERAASPISDLFRQHSLPEFRKNPASNGFRMPDEMCVAQITDPSIFTQSVSMYIDITTAPGSRYGDSMFWDKNWDGIWEFRVERTPQWYAGPPPGARLVDVITAMDVQRFKQHFVDLMIKPIQKA
jgi:purine nucleosidase